MKDAGIDAELGDDFNFARGHSLLEQDFFPCLIAAYEEIHETAIDPGKMFQKSGLHILLVRIDIVPDEDNDLCSWGEKPSVQKRLAQDPAMLLVLDVDDFRLELAKTEIAARENPTC